MRLNSSRFSRVKWRLILSSVDKWLTKNCIKKIKSLIFSDLIKNRVPRTGLEPARLSTLAPETSASTIPPPGLSELRCKGSAFRAHVQIFRDVFLLFFVPV
jgi:hypothetical protein